MNASKIREDIQLSNNWSKNWSQDLRTVESANYKLKPKFLEAINKVSGFYLSEISIHVCPNALNKILAVLDAIFVFMYIYLEYTKAIPNAYLKYYLLIN